ncbi:MAG TPA: hypothetical protein VMO47_06600 [Rhodothermales bacterium]|nr:hypothetical protein [Rhodothermales bacterium]
MNTADTEAPTRTLSRGDIHLLLAGIFLVTFVLVRFTDPADYGMTLHPRLDRVWTMWRMIVTGGWLLLALLLAVVRRGEARMGSISYAAASASTLGLISLAVLFPQSSAWVAILGSLFVYVATSGALCAKVQRPIPAALLGGLFFVLQVLTDGTVHFMTGVFRIH